MALRSFLSACFRKLSRIFSKLSSDLGSVLCKSPGSPWQPWGVFLLISFLSRFPYFFHGDIDWDESTFILLGQSVLDGHLPYTDVLDVKPPLLWYGFAALIFLGGKTFLGVRTLGTIVVTTIAYFSYRVAGHLWGSKTAWIASLSWIILISLAAGGQAVISEHLALLFLGASFTILVIYPQGLISFFSAGILMVMAVLIRLNLAYTVVCLGLYFLIRIFTQNDRHSGEFLSLQRKKRGLEFLAFSLGGFSILVMIILPYVLTQNLSLFYTGFIRASLSYTEQHSILAVLWLQFQKVIFLRLSVAAIVLSVLIFWALGVHGRWVWQHRQALNPAQNPTQLHFYSLIAVFILSIQLSILRTGVFYSHYNIQFLFFISLLVAKPIEQIIDRSVTASKSKPLPQWLNPYFKFSLGCVLLHHLLQYGLILSLLINKGTPFYGASFYITNVIQEQQLEGAPLWIQTNHLAYWLTDSPPVTPAVVHPSNINKPFLLQAWYGDQASSLTELQKIIDRQPALMVSDGAIETYFQSNPEAQILLDTFIDQQYQLLNYSYRDLRFYRHQTSRGEPQAPTRR